MKKIDYNLPITREHLDIGSYNAKFKLADQFLETNELDKDLYRGLLMDHSTFSYLNFKLDNKRLKPYPYQDMILNDKYRFKYLECANQTGKSVTSNIQGGSNILRDHNYSHNECIISASLDLSKFQMRRIKQILRTMETIDWKEVEGDVDNVQAISVDIKDYTRPMGKQVKYTNLLLCAPCSAGSLGYDFHDMNLDEFEFWKDIDLQWFFNQIAKPRTYKTKGNIIITTNPNGAENYGAELTRQFMPDKVTRKWHVYNFNYLDSPGNTPQGLEEEMIGLTRAQVESTLMAIRTLSDKYYFTTDEIDQSISEKLTREKEWYGKSKETYWFLDIGAKKDQSVLTGAVTRLDEYKKDAAGFPLLHVDVFCVHVYPAGYPISRVVGSFDESQATDGWHEEKSVKEYLDEYQVVKNVQPSFGVDVTGNSGISPLFRSVGIEPVDITFSGPKKWGMYQRMKYFLEQKLLHVMKHDLYDYQMKRIVVTRLKTSTYNRVGHENEDDFDDVPDSIAGLIYLCDNPVAIEPSIEVF